MKVEDQEAAKADKENGRHAPAGASAGHQKSDKRHAELVRLIMQYLTENGYKHAARAVEAETQVVLEEECVVAFREAVLAGLWDQVEGLVATLSLAPAKANTVRFMVYEQMFLELLDSGEIEAALACIREKLAPLHTCIDRLHRLSSFLMCKDGELKLRAQWQGKGATGRAAVLGKIQHQLPAQRMIPGGRLDELMMQAVAYQKMHAVDWGNRTGHTSLLEDPRGSTISTLHTMKHHTDEVWHVAFSHDGKHLASASRDCTIIIWNTADGSMVHQLTGHTAAVSYVAWSPNDKMLLSCGGKDKRLKVWDTTDGGLKYTIHKHTGDVCACAWHPSSTKFISAAFDDSVYYWNTDMEQLDVWSGIQVNSVAITHDGKQMVTVCMKKKISVFALETVQVEEHTVSRGRAALYSIQERDNLLSLVLAKDGIHALVTLSCNDIHEWNLKTQTKVRTFHGHVQNRYYIRSCYGGTDEEFVLSGSEDNKVYVWDRAEARLLDALEGHKATVSSVCWNPQNGDCVFASASDDRSVRLWGVAVDET